jgi:hypothetical protein
MERHPDNINRGGGFSLSRSWKPLIQDLREQTRAITKNVVHQWALKRTILSHASLSAPYSAFSPLYNLLEDFLLAQILLPIPCL